MTDYRLPACTRIKHREEISRVFEQGRKKSDAMMTLFGVANERGYSRFCVAVGSRFGGAVQRNRAKRLCREAFRLTRHELPAGWDFCVLPRAGAELTLEKLQRSLATLTRRVAE